MIAVNIIVLSFTSRRYSEFGPGRVAISFVAPFQELVTRSLRFARHMWENYFFLVSASRENIALRKSLNKAIEKSNQWHEVELANRRLRKLLHFKQTLPEKVLAAEVIGEEPSAWFKTVIIDRGRADGVKKGLPAVMPRGIAGQVVEVAEHYSKVMLIIDPHSAVDALVQRTRARGIIKGAAEDRCRFEYVLRKDDVRIGDTVIASGLDGVYPKGLRVGRVTAVSGSTSEIFKHIMVVPFVDFGKLEELLVILNPRVTRFAELR